MPDRHPEFYDARRLLGAYFFDDCFGNDTKTRLAPTLRVCIRVSLFTPLRPPERGYGVARRVSIA